MNLKQRLAGWAFKKLLRSNGDGWVLTQRGNQYTIDPLDRDPETDACCHLEISTESTAAESTMIRPARILKNAVCDLNST